MNAFLSLFDPLPSRAVPWAIFLGAGATLGGALLFEHWGGLAPCALCLTQRIPYWVALAPSALAIFFSREANLGYAPLALLGLCSLIFLVSAGLGGYHAGVEYGWWPGPESCTGGGTMATSLEALRAGLEGAKVPQCDEVPWSLFGISLAGFNFFISLGLAALAALPILRFLNPAHAPSENGPVGDANA